MSNLIPNTFLFSKKNTINSSYCSIKKISNKVINYKNVDFLKKYISEKGRIIPSKISGVSSKKQRLIRKSIQISRYISLLPYISL